MTLHDSGSETGYLSVPLPQGGPALLNALPEGECRDICDTENCVKARKCPIREKAAITLAAKSGRMGQDIAALLDAVFLLPHYRK